MTIPAFALLVLVALGLGVFAWRAGGISPEHAAFARWAGHRRGRPRWTPLGQELAGVTGERRFTLALFDGPPLTLLVAVDCACRPGAAMGAIVATDGAIASRWTGPTVDTIQHLDDLLAALVEVAEALEEMDPGEEHE